MKSIMRAPISIPIVAFACAALVTPVLGQTTTTPRVNDPVTRDTTRTDHATSATHGMKPTKLDKASGLIGVDVKNTQDETLGEIEDIVIDFQSGKVSYLVMASGGVLGLGEKKLAVPINAFSVSTDEDGDDAHLVLRATKDSIDRAEGFGDRWPSTSNPSFGAAPFWQERDDRQTSPNTDPIRRNDPLRDTPDRID
jgi:sporulation protein YlmC with PRC-barrel domain